MLFRFVLGLCISLHHHTQAAIVKPCATGSPRRGGRKGGAWQRDRRNPFGLVRRRVAPNRSPNRKAASSATIGSPSRTCRRKCVRATGKSLNMGPGLHRTNMVGHDPEDQRRRPLRCRVARSVRGVDMVPLATLELKYNSPRTNQNDALRQRGPPGPLARTHRG